MTSKNYKTFYPCSDIGKVIESRIFGKGKKCTQKELSFLSQCSVKTISRVRNDEDVSLANANRILRPIGYEIVIVPFDEDDSDLYFFALF